MALSASLTTQGATLSSLLFPLPINLQPKVSIHFIPYSASPLAAHLPHFRTPFSDFLSLYLFIPSELWLGYFVLASHDSDGINVLIVLGLVDRSTVVAVDRSTVVAVDRGTVVAVDGSTVELVDWSTVIVSSCYVRIIKFD